MMADSCEPLAVSCQLKVLNDGARQGVIMSECEGSAAVMTQKNRMNFCKQKRRC